MFNNTRSYESWNSIAGKSYLIIHKICIITSKKAYGKYIAYSYITYNYKVIHTDTFKQGLFNIQFQEIYFLFYFQWVDNVLYLMISTDVASYIFSKVSPWYQQVNVKN